MPWLSTGIVVKVMSKAVGGGAFYKAKGTVMALEPGNPFVGVVAVPAPGAAAGAGGAPTVAQQEQQLLLKLDQADLETVIPAVGEAVRFVRGPRRGAVGVLRAVHVDDFQASVAMLPAGAAAAAGRGAAAAAVAAAAAAAAAGAAAAVVRVEYEDISKLA